jgi:hypothetical protein
MDKTDARAMNMGSLDVSRMTPVLCATMASEDLFDPDALPEQKMERALEHLRWAERLLAPPSDFAAYPAAELIAARAARAAAHAAVASGFVAALAQEGRR